MGAAPWLVPRCFQRGILRTSQQDKKGGLPSDRRTVWWEALPFLHYCYLLLETTDAVPGDSFRNPPQGLPDGVQHKTTGTISRTFRRGSAWDSGTEPEHMPTLCESKLGKNSPRFSDVTPPSALRRIRHHSTSAIKLSNDCPRLILTLGSRSGSSPGSALRFSVVTAQVNPASCTAVRQSSV